MCLLVLRISPFVLMSAISKEGFQHGAPLPQPMIVDCALPIISVSQFYIYRFRQKYLTIW